MNETTLQDTIHETSVDASEVEKFAAIAAEWWNPDGKFKPLHQLTPARLGYLRAWLTPLASDAATTASTPSAPLKGLRVLDIGCGGGLIAEPLARLGAEVIALDVTRQNIEVARAHAQEAGLEIDYRHCSAESLAGEGLTFDAVLALEVVEHTADVDAFLATIASLTRPGGRLILSTLNRTSKAFVTAIIAAEYVLGWVPRGTHDWKRFIKPSELAAMTRQQGLQLLDASGLVYNPIDGRWRLSDDNLEVNYLMATQKPATD